MTPLIDRGLTMECNDVPADSLDNSSLASICSWQTVDMFEGRLKDGHSGSSSYVAMKVFEKIRGEGGIFGENCVFKLFDLGRRPG